MSYGLHYRGLLQELRSIAPPLASAADGDDDDVDDDDDVEATSSIPRKRVLVYDTRALIDTDTDTLRVLCCYPFNNVIVVPEVVLDAFDTEDKQLRRHKAHGSATMTTGSGGGGGGGAVVAGTTMAASAMRTSLQAKRDEARVLRLRERLANTLKTLLLHDTQHPRRIVLQRVEQYSHAYIRAHAIDPRSLDPRLLVACAKYFAQPRVLARMGKNAVLMVASDDDVYTHALHEQLDVCRGKEVYRSGRTHHTSS